MDLRNFVEELKKRNVLKAALAYLVISWLILQVASIVLPIFNTPEYVLKTLLFLLTIGFPIWLIYDMTPDGLKKSDDSEIDDVSRLQTRNRLNRVIIGALSLAVILLLVNLFNNNLGWKLYPIRPRAARIQSALSRPICSGKAFSPISRI